MPDIVPDQRKSYTGSPHWRLWISGIVVPTRPDFFESVAVFVQLATRGLLRAGNAMALAHDAGQAAVAASQQDHHSSSGWPGGSSEGAIVK
jgi:hypothetical protein